MKVPSGLYDLLSATGGIPDPLDATRLTNTNIKGFRWRSHHAVIQPVSAASSDWSTIDDALDAMAVPNQKLGLSVAFGDSTSRFYYDNLSVEEFILDPLNEVGSMPIPWDAIYLPLLLTFIGQMGAIYNPHPLVSYVVCSGFMQHFEGYLAKTADEESRLTTSALAAGFSSLADAWQTTGQAIVSAFVTAFPDTAVLYTSAKPFPSDAGGVQQNIFRDWISDTYPGHAGWMTAQLKAVVPPYPPRVEVGWPYGFQAIFRCSDLTKLYGAGNVPSPPPVPPQPVTDLINNGIAKGAQFLEIYDPDMLLAANQSTLSELNPLLKSFTDYVPPGTVPPPPDPSPPPVTPPPIVIARPVVPRIIPCATGTHARNIILARKRFGAPVVIPLAPGAVEQLTVVTPHTPSSGQATATWLSPAGSDAANLTYIAYLTGGSGTVTIVSQEPV